jgi:hypothetical protein
MAANTSPYHTETPELRDVHHNRSDCPDGKRILASNKLAGTGGKPLCKECKKIGG